MSARTLHETTQPGRDRTVTWRSVAFLAALTAVSVAPYLAGVLVPYYVNDLDELTLAEVASGRHDPKDLWPQGAVGGWVQLAGFLSLGATPMCLLAVGAGCLYRLWSGRPRRGAWRMSAGVAVGLVAVLAVCTGVLVFLFSPMGTALVVWRMD